MNKIVFTNRITDVWDYPKQNIYCNDLEDTASFYDFLMEEKEKRGIRIYIHIPFCNSFCPFCQFFKEPCLKDKIEIDRYFNAVKKEIYMFAKSSCLKSTVVTSIFFGGGDPAAVDIQYIYDIIQCIAQNYTIDSEVSITCEGNIRNFLRDNKIKDLNSAGVSRVSFGVQTFSADLREKLSLKPTLDELYSLVEVLNKYYTKRFSFDLMYNLPDQTEEMIRFDIEKAAEISPEYIDYYNLNLYPNTIFYETVYEKNRFTLLPSKKRELDFLNLICNELLEKNYTRILSCTFSRRHSIPHKGLYNYLRGEEMIGIGPSARGFIANRQYRNVCSVSKYVEMIEENKFPGETGLILSPTDLKYRKMILQIPLFVIPNQDIVDDEETRTKMLDLEENGYIKIGETYHEVTDKGKLWIGNIQKYLFSACRSVDDFNGFVHAIKEGRSAYNQDFMSVRRKSETSN